MKCERLYRKTLSVDLKGKFDLNTKIRSNKFLRKSRYLSRASCIEKLQVKSLPHRKPYWQGEADSAKM